jgi:hypothetical protein
VELFLDTLLMIGARLDGVPARLQEFRGWGGGPCARRTACRCRHSVVLLKPAVVAHESCILTGSIWLRPVTYRATCDLTRVSTNCCTHKTSNLRLFVVVLRRNPGYIQNAFVLYRCSLAVLRDPRLVSSHLHPNFAGKPFAGIQRVNGIPARRTQNE